MTDAPVRTRRSIVLGLLLSVATPGLLIGQSIDVGGLAFVDYFYVGSSPVDAEEGIHGFTYRRLYLTTDFQLADDWNGRARLEANDETSGPRGPAPFVKDLYLTWTYSGDHSATLGVAPPPAFQIAERVWGYRSLEKTILDFQGIVSSRDFGIRLDGPIASGDLFHYAAMYANNSGARPESDVYKRAYVQIDAQATEAMQFSVGADHAGYGDSRESSTRLSGFGGYSSDAFRLGVEIFYSSTTMRSDDRFDHTGLSLFGAVQLSPRFEAVGRVDRAKQGLPGADMFETFVIGGVSFQPNEFIELTPNVWVLSSDDAHEPEVLGRFTVSISF